jgi:hypothetical protein
VNNIPHVIKDKVTFAGYLYYIGIKPLLKEQEIFLSSLDTNINKQLSKRNYLKLEKEDCKQFILMCLIKSYNKKYMYTNWKKVLTSIIERKAIDFNKTRKNDISRLVNESEIKTFIDDDNYSYENIIDENINNNCLDNVVVNIEKCLDNKDFDNTEKNILKKILYYIENKNEDAIILLRKNNINFFIKLKEYCDDLQRMG